MQDANWYTKVNILDSFVKGLNGLKKFINEVNLLNNSDTKIIKTIGLKLGKYIALHQKWLFDGIKGESLIFRISDILNLNKNQLIELSKQHLPNLIRNTSEVTYSKKELYIFFNFNFH